MDKYMKKSDVIAYIRNEAKEAQSAFEELGGESGIIAEAFEDLANELEDFPATDVAPVVHGRWLEKKTWSLGRWVSWFECSECGDRDYNAEMYEAMPFCNVSNYCPNCGAKMGDAE